MARESSVIYQQMLDYLQANYGQQNQPFFYYFHDANGNPITPSKTSFLGMIYDVESWGINLFEQILDVKKSEYLQIADEAIWGVVPFIRKKVLEFQYGDVPSLDNSGDNPKFGVIYNPINPANRIVTFASVFNSYALNSTFGGTGITINAAKGSTPTALSGPELSALIDYLVQVIPPGIPYTIQTGSADFLRVIAEVIFDSRYESTIQADVFAQMQNYIYNLQNRFTTDGLLDAMNNAKGVVGIKPKLIGARDSGTGFAFSTTIFAAIPGGYVPLTAGQEWFAKYGYMVEENTSGHTWSDEITFTPITV